MPWERAHVCVRVRTRASVVCPSVETCVGIDACSSRHLRMPRCTHRDTSAAPSTFVCSPDPRVCAYVWNYIYGVDGSAWTGVHRYACICICMDIYNDIYPCRVSIMYLNACMYVGTYGHVAHTGVDACVCPGRCHAHRWVHVCLSPSVQRNI